MRSSFLTAAGILVGMVVFVQFVAYRWDPLLIAVLCAVAGLAAGLVLFEDFSEQQAKRDAVDAMADWLQRDPWQFGKQVSDLYAVFLRDPETTGDTLAEGERSAAYAGDALTERARICRVARYEELLQSRQFDPGESELA